MEPGRPAPVGELPDITALYKRMQVVSIYTNFVCVCVRERERESFSYSFFLFVNFDNSDNLIVNGSFTVKL